MHQSVPTYVILLGLAGIARAVLHSSLVVDRAGTRREIQADKPAATANGTKLAEFYRPNRADGHGERACAALRSVYGSMYTIGVGVGTPEQVLDVVVDTGSNRLVVESCLCRENGYCAPSNKCFRGAISSTLGVVEGRNGPSEATLIFGSGSITAEVASDSVRIGSLPHMTHSMLLMVEQKLDFNGPFEGILGLGLPNSKDSPLALRIAVHKNLFDKYTHHSSTSPMVVMLEQGLPGSTTDAETSLTENELSNGSQLITPMLGETFLREAGISRFSLCFNDVSGEEVNPNGGVLRFDPPEASDGLKSIGEMHWGLDFRGFSVGASQEKLDFCSEKSMLPSQETPCGAIPDSGTTYIMGPQEQVNAVFEEICNQWPRCISNYTKMMTAAEAATEAAVRMYYSNHHMRVQPLSKVEVFNQLLQDCDSWLDATVGTNELPPIHMHIGDKTGRTKVLTLDARSYTVYIQAPEVKHNLAYIPDVGEFPAGKENTGQKIWMCKAGVDELDYPTAHNGPGWILGMPIFHRYTVGFNVAEEPPSISFTEGECGSCSHGAGEALLERGTTAGKGPSPLLRPRLMTGMPRIPSIDTMQPF